jgi:hypothetical protein
VLYLLRNFVYKQLLDDLKNSEYVILKSIEVLLRHSLQNTWLQRKFMSPRRIGFSANPAANGYPSCIKTHLERLKQKV